LRYGGAHHVSFERRNYRRDDLILHRENVACLSVKSFGPDVVAGAGIDQLDGYAYAFGRR